MVEINHGLPQLRPGRAHLEEDLKGNLWLGFANYNLYKLSPPFYTKSDSMQAPNIVTFTVFGDNRLIRALEVDSKNNLWVGFHRSYLAKINLNQNTSKFVNISSEIDLREDYQISNIFEDSQGDIWCSIFDKGLIRYNQRSKEVQFYQDDFYGVNPSKLYVLREDGNKNLWLAGDKKLIKYNLETSELKTYFLPNKSKSGVNRIVNMIVDNHQQTWVLSQLNGLYQFEETTGRFLTFNNKKKSRDTWWGSENYVTKINQIIKDKHRGFWALVGNGYGGLFHLDIYDNQIDTLHYTPLRKNVLSIIQDSTGNIWAGSDTDLLRYDVDKDTVFAYSMEDGLENNKVFRMIEDKNKNIWLYTPLGLSILNKSTKEFSGHRQLNVHKLILGNNLNLNLFTINKNGTIKTLMKGGFISFHPDSLKKSKITPTIQIEKINAAGETVFSNRSSSNKLESKLGLSYNQNDLSIDFLGINFDDAKSHTYAYQLEGINETWVNTGVERTARYPNLPSGNYTFKVKAANADGIWSEPKSIKITINPPWWQTWWAYSLYVLAGVGALLWYMRNMNLKLKKEQAHNQELAAINTANQRFVPNDFLQILGKDSIKDLKLGDQTQTQMTVLFSDIRDYTPLSESMTPEENFKFINAYLGRVGPIIKAHGGFISTYLGDGFMALFVNEPENALKASIAAQKELDNYNRERKATGKRALKTGMGLNTGDLMLGVIGDEHRYESTVISDAVNTASRMEGLTKIFGSAIILSDKTLAGLRGDFPSPRNLKVEEQPDFSSTEKLRGTGKVPRNEAFAYRYLGKVKVKGKDKAIKIYDLYEGETVAIRELKAQTKLIFEQGISHYFNRQFGKAAECFKQVLITNERDKAAQYYLDKSVSYIVNGVSEDWSGVEEMVMK